MRRRWRVNLSHIANAAILAIAAPAMSNAQNVERDLEASARTLLSASRTNTGFFIVFVGLTVIGLFVSYKLWQSGNNIQDAQRRDGDLRIEKLRFDHDKELTILKTDLASQQERAAIAEQNASDAKTLAAKAGEGTAKALADAAQAAAKAEEFRLDIAKANERAANASATAERERIARLQLEAKIADRAVTDIQRVRLQAAFAGLKGQTVDVGVFGDTPDIANVAGSIRRGLTDAGVLLQNFSPLGSGVGVRGVLVGVRGDAPEVVKTAANALIAILGETLGAGVGFWDFSKLTFGGGAMMTGGSPGATPLGQSPLRIWVGSK